jgi:formylmethanofuran dehydrogenase subunit E
VEGRDIRGFVAEAQERIGKTGIRIGLGAMQRLGAERRELLVSYTDGPESPCACVLDGVAIAVSASLGRRTLTLDPGRTATGWLGRVTITHKKSGRI